MKEPRMEESMRQVLQSCSDCDTCRYLMDESCLLFPELYRFYDTERETGHPTGLRALRGMADLCTLCGLCPCPNIRMDIIRSKIRRVKTEGMPMDIRMLADVQQFGRCAGVFPKIVNWLFSIPPVKRLVKKAAGIHPRRPLPPLASENFFAWAEKKGLGRPAKGTRKAAYFVGCTAGYFFPQVAKSTVEVLHRNNVSVHVPPQQCCGMPTLLEGDLPTTLKRVSANMKNLLALLKQGYELICSCPTCAFFMKVLLREGAYYSGAYQKSINAGEDEIVVPERGTGKDGWVRLKRSIYKEILKDDSHFSTLDPMERITLSENIMDAGEYLLRLFRENPSDFRFGKLPGRMVYFAPCHQREQEIGRPYPELMSKIPGLKIETVGGAMDCCGMGGSLGYKKDFYDASTRLAARLVGKIRTANPQAIITDCLSCRLQFQHLLPYPVYHPMEIIGLKKNILARQSEEDVL